MILSDRLGPPSGWFWWKDSVLESPITAQLDHTWFLRIHLHMGNIIVTHLQKNWVTTRVLLIETAILEDTLIKKTITGIAQHHYYVRSDLYLPSTNWLDWFHASKYSPHQYITTSQWGGTSQCLLYFDHRVGMSTLCGLSPKTLNRHSLTFPISVVFYEDILHLIN